MLISLSGLLGVGKTTIAMGLARQIGAVHLHIDAIEQAIRQSGVGLPSQSDAGYRAAYRVAYAIATENLRLGRTVIADCVNPIAYSRDAWVQVAKSVGVAVIEVEIVCSDAAEHQRRLKAGMTADEEGQPPRWQQVTRNYQTWDRPRVVIDTAYQDVGLAVELLRRALATS
jgi:predicted kinase